MVVPSGPRPTRRESEPARTSWEMELKAHEKALELNICVEILATIRGCRQPKCYLCSLTSAEKHALAPGGFFDLPDGARLLAFQFLSPHRQHSPHDFQLQRGQHAALYALAQLAPRSVMYVLPFYHNYAKLRLALPSLLVDTWQLALDDMPLVEAFGDGETQVLVCDPTSSTAQGMQTYAISRVQDFLRASLRADAGVSSGDFMQWYEERLPSAQGGDSDGYAGPGLYVAVLNA